MRILVVGATGVIGRGVVSTLLVKGHDVVGTTTSPGKVDSIRAIGAEPAVVDILDRMAITETVRRVSPEVVVNEATALSRLSGNLRLLGRELHLTNRLRADGTKNLVDAARASGVRRIVAQSFAGWTLAREGGPVKTEEDPLDRDPPKALRAAVEAFRALESAVLESADIEGIVLRYGYLYGPGTQFAPGSGPVEALRSGKLPVVGRGEGVWSFVHIEDAVSATIFATERPTRGIYNIVDDEPACVADWLPVLASAMGAPPPRRVPTPIARMAIGHHGVVMMTQARGASNARANRELGWSPVHSTWRKGFPKMMEDGTGVALRRWTPAHPPTAKVAARDR